MRTRFLVMALVVGSAAPAHAGLVISDDATAHMSCAAGICTSTGEGAVLNSRDLSSMLRRGAVTVRTANGAVTITIASMLGWASANRLTLDATFNVGIRAPVRVTGPGGLTIITNDGGTGGDLHFFPGGTIDFLDLGSSLIKNGTSFTLIKSIGDIPESPTGNYALVRDLDLSGHVFHDALVKTFSGIFEGLGHSIDHLTIVSHGRKKPKKLGLIGILNGGAEVRDVNLPDVRIETSNLGVQVGAIAGINYGAVLGSSASGTIIAYNQGAQVGGLVGLWGSIIDSSFQGTVEADSYQSVAGGLGGAASVITSSHAAVTVNGQGAAGGLNGVSCAIITGSYASGSVTGVWAGGLLGGQECQPGTVDQSYSIATVHGSVTAGGLMSSILSGSNDEFPSTISNSYAAGAVVGGDAGGLVGTASGVYVSLTNCYSLGTVSSSSGGYVGGSIGRDDPIVTRADLYWDLDTSGVSNPSQGAGNIANDPGITGISDAQLKTGLPKGFDHKIWREDPSINNGYPYLLANPPQ